jgi:hypothetical protein
MLQAAEKLSGPSIETIEALLDVTYTWGYQETRQKLRDLYDKAVRGQWISDDVLPWGADVDLEKPMGPEQLMPLFGSDIYAKMTEKERKAINIETFAWTLSRPRSSSTPSRISTASSTRPRRSWTRRATSMSTTGTSTTRSGSRIRSTRTSRRCST